jgi:LPS sulfotransferase NodH
VKPTLSYLVCATPRSGSTLLCDLLEQTAVAGRPEEYFEALRHSGRPRRPHEYFDPERHANIVERLAFREMPDRDPTPNALWDPERYDRYLAWALEQGMTPNGVFGAKLMWGYLGDFAQLLRSIEGMAGLPIPELLDRSFPGLRYVRITRTDKIRQAVSLWKAVQTQAWRAGGGDGTRAATEPVFSFRAINYLVRLLTAHDASWDAYFLGLGVEPLKVTYEELAEGHGPVVRRVLEYLGVTPPPDLRFTRPHLSVQADDLSEQWVRRVNDHLAALEGPLTNSLRS